MREQAASADYHEVELVKHGRLIKFFLSVIHIHTERGIDKAAANRPKLRGRPVCSL